MVPPHQPRLWQRWVQRLAALRPFSWALSYLLPRLDSWELNRSRGDLSLTTLLTGLPVITLHTTGARSGLPRRTLLVAIPQGGPIVLIASNFGSPHHPAWYHNLLAHPQVQVSVDGRTKTYLGRQVDGVERETYWRLAAASFAGFEAYQRRAAGRCLPVIVLEPLDAAPPGGLRNLP